MPAPLKPQQKIICKQTKAFKGILEKQFSRDGPLSGKKMLYLSSVNAYFAY